MIHRIKVYWWDEIPNFGDTLNPLFIRELFGLEVERAELEDADLTASGSVIQWITPVQNARTKPITVWGSGFIFAGEPPPSKERVNFRAVRGRNSAAFANLETATVAFGDPGLLADAVVRRPPSSHAVGVVAHLNHRDNPTLLALAHRYNAHIIDVTAPPHVVITDIASCQFIFSSSLHGLIVADSFGIPNCWISMTPEPFGGRWKFDDYYSNWPSLSINPLQIDNHVDLQIEASLISESYSRPDLGIMKEGLISAFPQDLLLGN